MTSFVDFAELKAAIRIEDVLPKLGLASPSRADQWRGPCPACDAGGDRALVVTPAKQAFYCFAARMGGDVIGFVAHVRGCGMKEAALTLAEWFDFGPAHDRNRTSSRNGTSTDSGNSTRPPERSVETQKLAPLSYLNPSHEAVLALGLSPETCEHFGAGYAPKGILRGRLAIPIHDPSGDLVAYCGRAVRSDQAPLLTFPKGFVPEQYVFNLHRMVEGELYCTADPLDVLLAFDHGVTNMVSLLIQKQENVVAFPRKHRA